ncbi:MAG: hypothetical protein LBV38_05765 [Alistipes sp.]|nr:hypothetical protein [Alistipes sp.]
MSWNKKTWKLVVDIVLGVVSVVGGVLALRYRSGDGVWHDGVWYSKDGSLQSFGAVLIFLGLMIFIRRVKVRWLRVALTVVNVAAAVLLYYFYFFGRQ